MLLHRAQIRHSIDVPIRIGLPVAPHVSLRFREVGFAREVDDRFDAWNLDDPGRLLAESQLGRQRRDAAARWIGIVASEYVQHPRTREFGAVRIEDGMTPLAHQMANDAGSIQRLAEKRFASNDDARGRIAWNVAGLQLDIDQ